MIQTPFDPSREVYVDYLVANGRLWIRRLFDEQTPPDKGLVIDPTWTEINWQQSGVTYGKAVYRRLEEGRWTITVTGDGSLGLARQQGKERPALVPTPPIRDYRQIEEDVLSAADRIGPLDVLGRALSR